MISRIKFIIWLCSMLFLIGFLLHHCCEQKIQNRKEKIENRALIGSIFDTLNIYKDKNNLLTNKINVLETQSTKDFLSLQIKDKEIQKLQEKVKYYQNEIKNKGSITIFEDKIFFRKDTIYKNTTYFQNLAFHYKDSSNYHFIDFSINPIDSIGTIGVVYHTTFTNSYTVVLGQEKNKPFVLVTNDNPYSSIQTLRAYKVEDIRSNSCIAVVGGITAGYNPFANTPYIGLGICLGYGRIIWSF